MHPGSSVYWRELCGHEAPSLGRLVQVAVHDYGVGSRFTVQSGPTRSAAKDECSWRAGFELLGIEQHHQVFARGIGVPQVKAHG